MTLESLLYLRLTRAAPAVSDKQRVLAKDYRAVLLKIQIGIAPGPWFSPEYLDLADARGRRLGNLGSRASRVSVLECHTPAPLANTASCRRTPMAPRHGAGHVVRWMPCFC